MTDEGHYQAAVCVRGHVIDSIIEPRTGRPEQLPEHCGKCGGKVLIGCPHGTTRIHGRARDGFAGPWQPADFCHHCAHPYPWASQEAMAYHLENLLDADDLPEGDRRALVKQLASLRKPAAGDPAIEKLQVAALRLFKSAAPKAWELAKPVLQVILTLRCGVSWVCPRPKPPYRHLAGHRVGARHAGFSIRLLRR